MKGSAVWHYYGHTNTGLNTTESILWCRVLFLETGEATLECGQYPSSHPSPSPIRLCLHVQYSTPLVKVELLEWLAGFIKKENDGETVTQAAPAIENREEATPDLAIFYVDFVGVDGDVAVCVEVTDVDTVTEALNNNIQAENVASVNGEDNYSVVQETPIPSATETMDHFQEIGLRIIQVPLYYLWCLISPLSNIVAERDPYFWWVQVNACRCGSSNIAMSIVLMILIATIIILIYNRFTNIFSYWRLKRVPFVQPLKVNNKLKDVLLSRIDLEDVFEMVYSRSRGLWEQRSDWLRACHVTTLSSSDWLLAPLPLNPPLTPFPRFVCVGLWRFDKTSHLDMCDVIIACDIADLMTHTMHQFGGSTRQEYITTLNDVATLPFYVALDFP
ncbi:unnamed protein product [Timema podura]|uniref:Uncharacterized protein n=1 Tax=Timema podura TaxID=61482 RepID=A0ABN7NYG8_TIMPD|nr:unnamed protein product [Timema podura]